MADKPIKRRREVERIEDWDDARYSHVPPRAAADERLTLVHLRVLILIGKVNTLQGWCQLSQKTAADLFGMHRKTVNAAVTDLVAWRYIERRTQAETKTSFCHYRVLIDEPEDAAGVPPTDGTPPEEGVPPTDGTCVTSGSYTGVTPEAAPPITKARAREIRDQRSLPPKSPNGGPSAKPVEGKWKHDALAALRERGRHRDAVDHLIAPLLASDKRVSLGKGLASAVDALAELAQAAHGIPQPALAAALARLIAHKQKLTPRIIRDEIDHARKGGAMIVVRRGTPQYQRWQEHFTKTDPRQSLVMARQDTWQVPSEWPPRSGLTPLDAAPAGARDDARSPSAPASSTQDGRGAA